MPTITTINIAIEIFSSTLCFIFIVCILSVDTLKLKINRVFIGVLLSNIAVMLSDALAFYSIGKPQTRYYVYNYIGNFFCYIFSYVLIIVFSYYITLYFSTKTKVNKAPFRAVLIIQCVAIALTVVALFNNMYFTIDENNIYHRESLYWLSQMLGMAGMAINAGLIIYHRKSLDKIEGLAFACYIILPVVAIIVQTLVYGLVTVYIASTITIIFIYIGIQAQQGRIIKEKELALTQSRISVMISQIQPHFLYNALASISHLCEETPTAQEAIIKFSEYLRVNMDSLTQNNPIPFSKELEHVSQYLWLEKLRFEERLNVEFNIEAQGFMLPALSLQPIVENAVRHGITKKREGGTVKIEARETETSYLITVTDDGLGFNAQRLPQDGRNHIGLQNVRARLAAMCGGALTVKSEIGIGTVAEIEIPKNAGVGN